MSTKRETENKENFLTFLSELFTLFKVIYAVGLGVENNVKIWAKVVLSAVASAITSGIIGILMSKSLIGAGCLYFIVSAGCHISLALVNSGGSWFNALTGGLFEASSALKEHLIATNKFAMFLNDLANQGFFCKIVQITLLFLSIGSLTFLMFILYKCLETFIKSAIQFMKDDVQNPSPKKRKKKRRSPNVEFIKL